MNFQGHSGASDINAEITYQIAVLDGRIGEFIVAFEYGTSFSIPARFRTTMEVKTLSLG